MGPCLSSLPPLCISRAARAQKHEEHHPAFLIHDRVTGQCHADGDDDEDDDGDGDGDDDDDDDDDDVSLWCAALSIVDRVSTCLDFSSSSPRCRAASALALDPSAAPVRCFFFLLSPCADPLVRRQGVRGCNDSPNFPVEREDLAYLAQKLWGQCS